MKLLTSHPFNREAFKATMRKLWRPVKMMKYHKMDFGLLMLKYEEKLDKEMVGD